MSEYNLIFLFIALVFLILLSGVFSGSETGMMALNRYRLRHLARHGQRTAVRVQKLLERPDRLLGIILIGNTFANIFASSIATLIAVHFFGDVGILFATIVLTFVILIFSEMTPKTLAALYPQKIAFMMALPLLWLLKLLYPVVWCANMIANGMLRLFGIHVKHKQVIDRLNTEELRTVVHDSVSHEVAGKFSERHKDMLLGVLDLTRITVEDAMLQRNDIVGIDINSSWEAVVKIISSGIHTRLPVYQGTADKMLGILHLRDAVKLMHENTLNKKSMMKILREPYFIPEGASLQLQLQEFRRRKKRLALVVDEYGDIVGLLTMEDILEEIVGELDADIASVQQLVKGQSDGGYLVDGSVSIRELNKLMHWVLPLDGPKTVSGLVLEWLETIPDATVGIDIKGYRVEVLEIKDNRVLQVKVYPMKVMPAL